MKDEAKVWLEYANENLASAQILLDHDLLNPCLQNAQQCVEKMLKAMLIETGIQVIRTHSIGELVAALAHARMTVPMTDEEVDLLDSIYLPSKYPLGSALPDFEPDRAVCDRCVGFALRLKQWVGQSIADN